MRQTSADKIIDVAARVGPLDRYCFVANSASCTVNGMFLNEQGVRTGARFTATVATNAGSTFTDIAGYPIPNDAVGAVLDISQDLVYDIVPESEDLSAAKVALAVAAAVAKAPTILAAFNVAIGRVA